MVKPAARKRLVGYLQAQHQVSERRACRMIPISRKAVRYEPTRPQQDAPLVARLKALGEQYPRYGYLMLHSLLRTEGVVMNRKRTYRLYTELGMQVRTKRRKKLVRPRVPMAVPTKPNERWSMDFVSDQLAKGRRFRVLNVVDDFSRECVLQVVTSRSPASGWHVSSTGSLHTDRCRTSTSSDRSCSLPRHDGGPGQAPRRRPRAPSGSK